MFKIVNFLILFLFWVVTGAYVSTYVLSSNVFSYLWPSDSKTELNGKYNINIIYSHSPLYSLTGHMLGSAGNFELNGSVTGVMFRRNLLVLSSFPLNSEQKSFLEKDECFLAHEATHQKQQEKHGGAFFVFYVAEYVKNLYVYGNRNEAYRHISYEKEAFEVEKKCREKK